MTSVAPVGRYREYVDGIIGVADCIEMVTVVPIHLRDRRIGDQAGILRGLPVRIKVEDLDAVASGHGEKIAGRRHREPVHVLH